MTSTLSGITKPLDPSSLIRAEVLERINREYCILAGISVEDFLHTIKIPPLSTVIRANFQQTRSSEDFQKIIYTGLFQENANRLLPDHRLLMKQLPQMSDTWIISVDCPESDDYTTDSVAMPDPSTCVTEIIVDCATAESCLRGAHVYAPGILGCSSVLQRGHRVIVLCDVTGICLKGRISKFDGLTYFIGSGIAQLSRAELFSQNVFPAGVGIFIDQPRYPLLSLNEFLKDNSSFSAQNLPSCVVVHVLDPQPGETVLDACAAPGGKTLHIASLMQRRGRLVALEKSAERATILSRTLGNMNGFCDVFRADAAALESMEGSSAGDLGSSRTPFSLGTFDRILVDAPCSASGLRPRLSFKSLHIKQLDSCPKIQRNILKGVVPLLKNGGILVYSTCSVLQQENEAIVLWALKEFPFLEIVKQAPHIGGKGFPMAGLEQEQTDNLQRFHVVPAETDTVGFFIAKMVKIIRETK